MTRVAPNCLLLLPALGSPTRLQISLQVKMTSCLSAQDNFSRFTQHFPNIKESGRKLTPARLCANPTLHSCATGQIRSRHFQWSPQPTAHSTPLFLPSTIVRQPIKYLIPPPTPRTPAPNPPYGRTTLTSIVGVQSFGTSAVLSPSTSFSVAPSQSFPPSASSPSTATAC